MTTHFWEAKKSATQPQVGRWLLTPSSPQFCQNQPMNTTIIAMVHPNQPWRQQRQRGRGNDSSGGDSRGIDTAAVFFIRCIFCGGDAGLFVGMCNSVWYFVFDCTRLNIIPGQYFPGRFCFWGFGDVRLCVLMVMASYLWLLLLRRWFIILILTCHIIIIFTRGGECEWWMGEGEIVPCGIK